jgi:hypothetical protein
MHQTARPALIWETLLQTDPSLQQYADAAVQAGRNAWRGWWVWIRNHSDYRAAVTRAAEALDVPAYQAGKVAEEYLVRLHRDHLPKPRSAAPAAPCRQPAGRVLDTPRGANAIPGAS